jgi:chromosome segregation ATPase
VSFVIQWLILPLELHDLQNEAVHKQEAKVREFEKADAKLRRLSAAMAPVAEKLEAHRRQIDEWLASRPRSGIQSIEGIKRGVTAQSFQKMIASELKNFKQKEALLSLPEGGVETVKARFKEQEEKLTSINTEIAAHKTNYSKLTETHKFLSEHYAKLREFLCGTVDEAYLTHLLHKKYDGKLLFDHEKETLITKVDVNSRDGERTKASFGGHQQLSGGENSYSNVCLLLALSSVSPCPWQVLDEFDVFM